MPLNRKAQILEEAVLAAANKLEAKRAYAARTDRTPVPSFEEQLEIQRQHRKTKRKQDVSIEQARSLYGEAATRDAMEKIPSPDRREAAAGYSYRDHLRPLWLNCANAALLIAEMKNFKARLPPWDTTP